jgi:hypothetical protein
MMRRACFVLYVLATTAQAATAQSRAGNIVTGEAKVEIISTYNDSETVAKPEKVMNQEFTPVGDIIMDESAAARLHRRLSLKHGSPVNPSLRQLTWLHFETVEHRPPFKRGPTFMRLRIQFYDTRNASRTYGYDHLLKFYR